VGGRELPRGIEVLVKKAAVDAAFKALLLEKRAEAAKVIALDLDPAEAAILNAISASQLEATIASTKVDDKVRPAFLGRVAAVMIAALGAGASACAPQFPELEHRGRTLGHSALRTAHLYALLEKEKDAMADSPDDGLHEERVRHLEALTEKEKRTIERARRRASAGVRP
jgi:hypothetical protein